MKKIFNIMIMALMVMFASCSSDDELTDVSDTRGEEIIINAAMNDTRVDINGYKMTWSDDDVLVLIGFDAQGKYVGVTSAFNYVSSEGANAQFKGFLIDGAVKYKAFVNTIYTEVNADGVTTLWLNYHNQYYNNSTSQLSEVIRIETDGFTTAEELKTKGITLKMTNSIMRVDLRSLPKGCNAFGFMKMFANYGEADQAYMGGCTFDEMNSLTNLTDASQHNYIYIPFEPTTLKSGKKLAIQFGTDNEDTSIFGSVSRAASADKVYAGGSMYDLVVESTDSGVYTNNMYAWEIK